jgi:thiamine biosynthesis lipoprotein
MMATNAFTTQQFRAMGSTIEISLVGGTRRAVDSVIAEARLMAETWESVFSRFRPESELSRLNAAAGSAIRVSPLLFRGISEALQASQRTHGLFDPTILPALRDLGYDRSFERIGDPIAPQDEIATEEPYPRAIASGQIVSLPPRTTLDLGGIVKGMFADDLATRLSAWRGGIVSAGGDLRVWGNPPDAALWAVGVEDPHDPERDIAIIELPSGAVATSGRNRRAWQRDGRTVHHLIDPRTLLPVESDICTVTAIADSATAAEIAATALFVAGEDEALVNRLSSLFTFAVVVRDSGEVQIVRGNMKESEHGASVSAA